MTTGGRAGIGAGTASPSAAALLPAAGPAPTETTSAVGLPPAGGLAQTETTLVCLYTLCDGTRCLWLRLELLRVRLPPESAQEPAHSCQDS